MNKAIQHEAYNFVEAQERIKNKETQARCNAYLRHVTAQENIIDAYEELNFKLTIALTIAIGYGVFITLKWMGAI